jgi:tetratricopeptide (TPR) repeat protein
MSLLMKALEKAAKDREGSETPPGTPPSKDGAMGLEPIAPRATPAREPSPAAPAAAGRRGAAADTPKPADAASVVTAGRRGGSSFLRERPLAVFGLVAGIGAVAYGGYVYLQLTNPALFVKQAPRPAPVAQITPPPNPQPAVTSPPATPPAPSLASLAPPDAPPPPAAATASTAPAKGALNAAPANPAPAPATVIGAAAPGAAQAAAAVAPERRAAQAAATPAAAAPAAAAAPVLNAPLPLASAPEAPRDSIRVTAGSNVAVLNPLLTEAYAAYGSGNLDASQRLYNQMLRSDPGNVDALLGLGAIATQQGNSDEATRRYLKVLELDPRNAPAQAGLIGMLGRADPQAAETRIKQLIAREPAAPYLQFALGIAYLDQKRWPDAQQAFFQAHQLQPDNPDYAFNLAVALEHIGQPKFALDYYRRALQLATAKGRANFSTVTAEERIGKLEKVVR